MSKNPDWLQYILIVTSTVIDVSKSIKHWSFQKNCGFESQISWSLYGRWQFSVTWLVTPPGQTGSHVTRRHSKFQGHGYQSPSALQWAITAKDCTTSALPLRNTRKKLQHVHRLALDNTKRLFSCSRLFGCCCEARFKLELLFNAMVIIKHVFKSHSHRRHKPNCWDVQIQNVYLALNWFFWLLYWFFALFSQLGLFSPTRLEFAKSP